MIPTFTVEIEIERSYRVKATIYRPDGEFLEMVIRRTVTDALRALADEVEVWAVNEVMQQMARAYSDQLGLDSND